MARSALVILGASRRPVGRRVDSNAVNDGVGKRS